MTRGLVRYHESGHSHFVTFSCYRRMRLLQRSSVCDLFLEKLEQTRVRFSLRVYGYVLMPEHVHLLLSEPDIGTLADALRSLKLSVSKTVRGWRENPTQRPHVSFANVGHQDVGDPEVGHEREFRLWQARYYDRNIRDYDEFRVKLRYIHRNPVKRGLCERPEDWAWSSFLHYATGSLGPVEIESEWTARNRERAARDGTTPR